MPKFQKNSWIFKNNEEIADESGGEVIMKYFSRHGINQKLFPRDKLVDELIHTILIKSFILKRTKKYIYSCTFSFWEDYFIISAWKKNWKKISKIFII